MKDNSIVINKEKGKELIGKGYIGKKIKMGIRPEHIKSSSKYIQENPSSVFKASVEVVELMGSESYIYMVFEGNKFTVKVNGSTDVKHGMICEFAIDSTKVHLFDYETGLAI